MTRSARTVQVVGRTSERRVLAEAFAEAAAGRGGVVLLGGEGGIGKSTLADELAATAVLSGARVVRGYGWEGAGAPPLVVWHEVLRALGAAASEVHPGGVLEALTAAALTSPLLVVVEDLHAADADSARVVTYLSSRLGTARVLVLVTYRPEDLHRTPGTAEALGTVASSCRTVGVQPLDASASAELVRVLSPLSAEPALLEAVVQRGDGNPFLLRELAQAAQTSTGVPAGVAAAVRARIVWLPPATRELLPLCACAGRALDVRLIAAASGEDVVRVLELLAPAEQAGALESTVDGGLRFRHALVAEAIAAALSPAERARHHLALAAALQQRRHAHAASVVHHLVQAGGAAAVEDLVPWCERAGQDAEAAGAPLEAARHWQRAAGLLAAGSRRGRLLERAGHALFSAGSGVREAAALFTSALADYDAAGEERRAAVVHSRLGAMLTVYPAVSDLDAAERHFANAARVLAEPVERARLLVGTSSLRLLRGDVTSGLVEAEQAERAAQAAGHAALAATAKLMRGAHCLQLGRLSDAFALLDGAFSTARDRPLVDVQAAWHGISAGVVLEDRTLAESYSARARGALRLVHLPGQEQILWDNLAPALALTGDLNAARAALAREDLLGFALQREFVAAIAGDWDGGLPRLAAMHDADEAAGQRLRTATAGWVRGWLLRLQGRYDEARNALLRPLPDVVAQSRVLDELRLRVELAIVEVAAGDTTAALAHLQRADDIRPEEDLRGLGLRLRFARAAVEGRGLDAVVADADRRRLPWLALDALARWADADPAAAPDLRARVRERLRVLGVEGTGWDALVGDPRPPGEVTLHRAPDGWTVFTAGGAFRLDDSKGLRHLARLVASPGREWHALDLVRTLVGTGTGPSDGAPEDPLVDPTARAAYRRRLTALEAEADDALALGDGERAARARAERDAIVEHLAAATGLGGRDRGHSREADRARQSVTKTLRAAVDRIAERDGVLGAHLRAAVRTGTFVRYEPDPTSRIVVRVSGTDV